MTRARSAQRRIFLDAAAEAAFGRAGLRQCDHPNCAAEGLFPAPKSREPRDGRWHFCLEHVRQYNSGWDFFRGMSDAEVLRYQREDVLGHRPPDLKSVMPGKRVSLRVDIGGRRIITKKKSSKDNNITKQE